MPPARHPLAAMLLLARCTGWTVDGRIDAREARILDAARKEALRQMIAWNAAGVDPVRLSPESLAMVRLGCGSAAALSGVALPAEPETAEQLAAWCAALVRAAGPAGRRRARPCRSRG